MELVSALLVLCACGACSVALSRYCPEQYSRKTGRVECCSKCPPGKFMEEECTETSDSICRPCLDRSYSKDWNIVYSCSRCDECSHEGMKYKQNCTATSNALCECIEGYVCKDEHCRRCVPKADMSPWYLNMQVDDTYSIHFPEQECGGLSHQEGKSIEQTYVTLNCAC
ncbi:tumor necrosis factor receptor superfamily member 1B-like [Cetorhinus maximus]